MNIMEKISFNNSNKTSSVKNENIIQIHVFEKIGYINIKLKLKTFKK